MRFFLGGYRRHGRPRGGHRHAPGWRRRRRIGRGELARRAEVAVGAESPSWIAWHPTRAVVYAALEGRGVVQAYRRTGEEGFIALGAPWRPAMPSAISPSPRRRRIDRGLLG
jgi:hypothetical protein